MPTVRIQEKNYSESIMVLKPKDGQKLPPSLLPTIIPSLMSITVELPMKPLANTPATARIPMQKALV